MMETDNLSRNRSVGQGDGSPRASSPRPMRQLEFNQAMSDFRHMFPETDVDVIEAVLRANSGMVDATIDQLLTMNIDAEFGKEDEEDDLPDHILMSMEQEVLAQQQTQSGASGVNRDREGMSKSSRKALEAFSSSRQDSEDCPPSYTEAVQSHLSHHYPRGSNSGSAGSGSRRHKHSSSTPPSSSPALPSSIGGGFSNGGGGGGSSAVNNGVVNSGTNAASSGRTGSSGHHHHHRLPRHGMGMQHLLDLGPDSAPNAGLAASGKVSPPVAVVGNADSTTVPQASGGGHSSSSRGQHSRHHHHHHHHHHHSSRSSNHHSSRRIRADNSDSLSPHHKSSSSSSSRPGRNLLASMSASHHSSPSYTHHELASDEFGFGRPQRKEASFDSPDSSRREKSPSHHWQSSSRDSNSFKRPAFKNWNPPMLGTLPDDFLRIAPTISSVHTHQKHAPHLHRAMSAIGPERPSRFMTTSSIEMGGGGGQGASGRMDSQMTSSFRHSGRPSGSSTTNKPHRSLSFAGHTSSHTSPHPRSELPKRALTQLHPSANLAQHEFRSDILQERMKENERRRHIAASSGLDPELTQYLEDERLAIMLQNSEFLQTLRGDRSFMMSLEQDHSSGDVEELPPPPPAIPEMTVTESTMVPTVSSSINPTGLGSDEEEGYGDEGRQTLEAFPFSKQLPPPANSEDMELRKKLKHMGKSSRKQFAALARKFFSKRKKKNAHQMYPLLHTIN